MATVMEEAPAGLVEALNTLLASDAVQRLGIAGLTSAGSSAPLVVTAARKFGFGQSNPTYHCTVAAPGAACVLRSAPAGRAIASAHAVDREFRVLRALYAVGYPVPRPLLLPPPGAAPPLTAPFYLMQAVHGVVFTDPALPHLTPLQRQATYTEAVRAAAALHALPLAPLGLDAFGPPEPYYPRQLRRLAAVSAEQARAAPPLDGLAAVLARLAAAAPPDERALIHGDFKVDNLMFAVEPVSGEVRLAAVLDWEMSTAGHPLADLATLCTAYWLPASSGGGGGSTMSGLAGAELGWEVSGIPTEEELVALYAAAAGRAYPIPHWAFCKAFALFKYAVIAQGIGARLATGRAASRAAAAAAAAAPLLMALVTELLAEDGAPPPPPPPPPPLPHGTTARL
mgnify:CR=1 FL=1